MDTYNRIRKFIKARNMTVQAFESSIGKSNGYIANTKSPTAKVLSEIARVYPDLSMEWLITGNGDMIKNKVAALIKDGEELVISSEYKIRILEAENEMLKDLLSTAKAEINEIRNMAFSLSERFNKSLA